MGEVNFLFEFVDINKNYNLKKSHIALLRKENIKLALSQKRETLSTCEKICKNIAEINILFAKLAPFEKVKRNFKEWKILDDYFNRNNTVITLSKKYCFHYRTFYSLLHKLAKSFVLALKREEKCK